MLVKTKGIVLHVTKYGDSQQIVDMITPSYGRVSFIVTLSRSPKAKIKPQYFQLLSILNIEFDYRAKLQLHRLKNVSIAVPLTSIPCSIYKICISTFIAEFLYYSTRNEVENEQLFQFLIYSILWLDKVKQKFANFHIVFMLRMSLFLGFFPNMENSQFRFFDLETGCFSSVAPIHLHYLNEADSRMMRILLRLKYDTMHLFQMSRAERNKCVHLILLYYRLHLPNFPELKSVAVLNDLYS